MQNSQLPTKITVPFANAADSSHKRTIPVNSQIGITLGAASFTDGFPPACFSPIPSGGSWPFGQDFNGLENLITSWLRWMQAGGVVPYDAAFQAAIGGYPAGCRVASAANPLLIWQSSVDNNMTNPDSGTPGGTGWSVPTFPDPFIGGLRILAGAGGQGANLALIGDGTTTPSKYLRAMGGFFDIVNNAYTGVVFRVNDTGDVSQVRNLTVSGDINASGSINAVVNVGANGIYGTQLVQASNGYVRALYGSQNAPTDANVCTIRNDFQFSNAVGGYIVFPSGFIFQWGQASLIGSHPADYGISYPIAFPHSVFQVLATSYDTSATYVAIDQKTQYSFVVHQVYVNHDMGWMAVGY